MLTEYRGRERWAEFLAVVQQANDEGGTVSPGGAGMLVGVKRQRIYEIVRDHADVRAWSFYGNVTDRQAEVYEVSVEDLLRWAVRLGRIRTEADLGLPWERTRELLQKVLHRERNSLPARRT
jgi:hypothetical protein